MNFVFAVALFLLIAHASATGINRQCLLKEKALAVLELAKDSLSKAKVLLPECDEGGSNKTPCGKKEKATAYIEAAIELIEDAKKLYPEFDLDDILEPEPEPTPEPEREPLPSDCLDVLLSGHNVSGEYRVRLELPEARDATVVVYCDMETDGGGWTVIQRRDDYKVQENFNRDWTDYKKGFGMITEDFWLGNDNIYYLSNVGPSEIRFDLQSHDLEKRYAQYSSFRIDGEDNLYKLHINGYKGNAGNGLYDHDQMFFTTKDKKNDKFVKENCAVHEGGGWWFNNCGNCNLNGLYSWSTECDGHKYLYYYMWRECEPLKFTEIKIRRKQ